MSINNVIKSIEFSNYLNIIFNKLIEIKEKENSEIDKNQNVEKFVNVSVYFKNNKLTIISLIENKKFKKKIKNNENFYSENNVELKFKS